MTEDCYSNKALVEMSVKLCSTTAECGFIRFNRVSGILKMVKTNIIILHFIIVLKIKHFSPFWLNIKLVKARKHQIRTSLANIFACG